MTIFIGILVIIQINFRKRPLISLDNESQIVIVGDPSIQNAIDNIDAKVPDSKGAQGENCVVAAPVSKNFNRMRKPCVKDASIQVKAL